MILEFYGLPGSGKTTLSEQIAREIDFRIVKIKNNKELFYYNFLFLVKHPIDFFITLFFIFLNSSDLRILYSKLANGFLHVNAKYQKALNYERAIIDQGYFQNIISIFDKEMDRDKIIFYSKFILKPDKLIFLDANHRLREERLKGRGYFPRKNFGSGYYENWLKVIEKNNEIFKNSLNYLNIDYSFIADSDRQSIPKIMENVAGKKIIYIANARIPTEKAHGYQIIKTIETLALAGAEVKLLLSKRSNNIKRGIFDFYGVEPIFKVIPAPNFLGFLEKIWPEFYFILQRFFFAIYAFIYGLFFKADVIYSREITICYLLSLFGKNVIFEDHEPKKTWRWLYVHFIKVIGKKVIVAVNLKELYEKFGVKKETFIFVPNGVDLKEFDSVQADKNIWQREFGLAPDDKIVLYTGHFYKWKGVDTLVKSAKYLDPQVKVAMIGGLPENQAEVKKMITELNLKNIFLHNFIEHKELIKFIKSADVLILPNTAKEERSSIYTTPIKLFESLASGVPLIASNLPSFKNYLSDGENAILFRADDPDDLAKKIKYLINNPQIGKAVAEQALKQAVKYSWNKRAEKILKFIK